MDGIRYQLLHRTASALIEAERFCAGHALMLVHSFSQTHEWFEDYARFLRLLKNGVRAEALTPDGGSGALTPDGGSGALTPGNIHHAGRRGDVELYLGWVTGEAVYLTR